MWLRASTRMPYHDDPDYRSAVVASIKERFGDVPVDVTLFATWGIFEVQLEDARASELAALPLVGSVRSAIDREMVLSRRVVV